MVCRCRMRGALAACSVALAALGLTSCTGSTQDDPPPPQLSVVEHLRLDRHGERVEHPSDQPRGEPANPAGDGAAVCPPVSLAMAGALDDSDGGTGVAVRNGIQMAIDKHNDANSGCQVQLKPFDTGSDSDFAVTGAPQIVGDAYTIGLIGPMRSDTVKDTGEVFDRAGLVRITPSATDSTLSANGWRTFFRAVANDRSQGAAVAHYLVDTLGKRKVCVVDDSSTDGLALAEVVRQSLGAVADPLCNIAVRVAEQDYSSVVGQITSAKPDSVFYSGHLTAAARFADQLRGSGFDGAFVTVDGAGTASVPEFVDEYTARFGEAPTAYSAEGYDLGTVFLKGIDSGAITRPDLLEFVRGYHGHGVARDYQWADNGELEQADVWIYQAQ